MGIGDKLQELIDKRHRNVNDVARSTGVPASTIYSIIRRNNTKVDLEILQVLADELCVTLDYFSDSSSKQQGYYLNDETAKLAQEIYDDPELKVVLDAVRKAKPEDLKFIKEMVKRMSGDND